MTRTRTINFREIVGREKYTVTCTSCGKTLTRTAKVVQTVNPFNKNADGSVKTANQVFTSACAEAVALAAKLAAQRAVCRGCQP